MALSPKAPRPRLPFTTGLIRFKSNPRPPLSHGGASQTPPPPIPPAGPIWQSRPRVSVDPRAGRPREREGPTIELAGLHAVRLIRLILLVSSSNGARVVLNPRAEQEPTKNGKRWRPSDHHSKQKCLRCCHCALLGTPGFAANRAKQEKATRPPLQRGS